MTVKAALQSTIAGYPVESNTFDRILIERGLDGTAAFDLAASQTSNFQLAKADVISHLLTAVNRSEGDLSISMTEKSNLLKIAQGIYTKYGEDSPLLDAPTVTQINVW